MPTKWGIKHGACKEALQWLEKYNIDHPGAGLKDAYRECPNGAWLAWALENIDLLPETQAALDRAVVKFVGRAVDQHALRCGVGAVEYWAQRWLSGEDRSRESADAAADAAEAAASAAAWAAWAAAAEEAWVAAADAAAWAAAEEAARASELRIIAGDIREEIPEWPWGAL